MSTVRTRKHTRRSTGVVVSVLTAGSLALAGCSAGGSTGEAATQNTQDANAPVTITVDSFGGIFDGFKKAGLLDDYKKLHPNVTVNYKEVQQEADYWTALQTKLQAGTGLADIQPIEVSRVAVVTEQQADRWVDMKTTAQASHLEDYPDWKNGALTTEDGKVLGFGTDAGPMAICFRSDKLKAAGLPSTGATLAARIKSFDDYEAVGAEYKAKTGQAWMDAAGGYYRVLTSVANEVNYDKDGKAIWTTNPVVRESFNRSAKVAQQGLTAKLEQFSAPWNTAMSTGTFATIACPAWMLGYIQEKAGAANKGNWDVMPLPGGASGNWGGSWLSIPTSSKNQAAAAELAAFLTNAESEAKEFRAGIAFPSNAKAIDQISTVTNPYFANAPIGKIFGDAAKKAPVQPYGIDDGTITTTLGQGLTSIENNNVAPEAAWQTASKKIEDQIGS